MQEKSIGKNAILNGIKTLTSLIFPLLTFPYISRILQVENIGKYNFANSIVNYFVLIAGLGISTYAVREGAHLRDNRIKLSAFVSEVFSINIISTVLAYVILLICIIFIPKIHSEYVLIMILSFRVIFTTLGMEWVFSIYEEYSYITIRGIIFQVVYTIAVFVLVKKPEDLILYGAITLLSTTAPNICNILFLKKYCNVKLTPHINLRKHLIPILLIFSSSVTTTIYVNSDITMLGFLTTDLHVGLYSVSAKIYNIVKQLLAAIIIVSIPRMALLWGKQEYLQFKKLAENIFSALLALIIPIVIGIYFLSENIVSIIAGNEYSDANSSLKILSIALIFSVFSWFFTSCILIPCKKERQVLLATSVAAVLNILLNIVLIPKLYEDAAAVTTVIAEGISLLICVYYSNKIIQVKIDLHDMISIVLGCTIMALIISYLQTIVSGFVGIIIITLVAGTTYILILGIMHNTVIVYWGNVLLKKISRN